MKECKYNTDWMATPDDVLEKEPIKLQGHNGMTDETSGISVMFKDLQDQALGMGMELARCSGPCECEVEPDGWCPQGWYSIPLVAGVI